uniref:OmpA-OmpF porin, OOP family protein (TC.OOP) n=1 Tax=uncultured marine group II/III euryarchaeote KM3_88_E02 TaxID=1456536 RepID=A0A075HUW3_9EURY|nr:OmpA-OmpF porin, OOP family protein (TC.OOP) [uncultured marine group II/III euryarchaeote KM3_88_E02]
MTHLGFSPNGLWLITASLDGNIRIWNAMDWQLLGDFPVHYVPIPHDLTGGIAISPDSSTVLSWTDYSPNPGFVSLELNSGNQERLSLSGCGILVFSPNGKILASGDSCTENTNSNIVLYEGDSDGDGILDSKDSCPNTELNAEVNSDGCSSNQVDSDGDGVYDYQDQCADTVDGATVDNIGCAMTQLDSDADGISDATDQCLNTPNGESVGLNGCSSSQVDSDGDGIYDSNDDCPSTPDGSSVEANGCATSGDDVVDIDSDSDGVRDSVDQCSNTDSGVIVGSSGCETEGDVQGTSNEELSDDEYAFIGCLVLIGIIAAIAFVVRSVNTSPRTSIYDHGYTHFDQGGTGVEMQSVMDELEQQRAQAQMEAQSLKLQLNEQSVSASKMATIQAELANLLQRVEDSEHAKRQMEQDMEEMRKKGDNSLLMQDSVTMGDNLVGSTKIGSQTVIGSDPESMAKAFKIIQDNQPKREGLVTRFLRWLLG